MLSVLNAIEMIKVRVDRIKPPMANGAALNTKSKFFKKINPPKASSKMSLKTF